MEPARNAVDRPRLPRSGREASPPGERETAVTLTGRRSHPAYSTEAGSTRAAAQPRTFDRIVVWYPK